MPYTKRGMLRKLVSAKTVLIQHWEDDVKEKDWSIHSLSFDKKGNCFKREVKVEGTTSMPTVSTINDIADWVTNKTAETVKGREVFVTQAYV